MAAHAYYVMQANISRERLTEAGIEIIGEHELSFDPAAPDEKLVCWVIPASGVERLRDFTYNVQVVPLDHLDERSSFVAIANPDGSRARPDADPRTIKLVRFLAWNRSPEQRARFKEIIEQELVPVVGDVNVFHNPQPFVRPPGDAGRGLILHLHSSPEHGQYDLPQELWGLSYAQHLTDRTAVGLWMDGTPFYSREGVEIGAIKDRNAYIYLDPTHAPHTDSDLRDDIFRHICKTIAEQIRSPGGLPSHEAVRLNYVEKCMGRANVEKRKLTSRVSELESKIEEHQKELASALREYRQTDGQLRHFDQYVSDMRRRLGLEFDKLAEMPSLKSVSWRGEMLMVETRMIFCIDPRTGHEHEIGEISIVIDGERAQVRFRNQTHQINGLEPNMQAPHVFPTGKACLGNMDSAIPPLIAKFEWAAAIHMCLHFLRDVNVADPAGKHIDKWPVHRTKDQIEAERNQTEEERRAALADAAASTADQTTATAEV